MHEEYLYKEELLNTFAKDGGLVDNVKLQLRHKIIDKLRKAPVPPQVPLQNSLLRKVSNTLLAEYLQNQRYFHSLAVFSPEANFTQHHFSPQEMQSMLNVECAKEESLLEALIKQALPRGRMVEKQIETGVQTDDRQTIQNLENRLSEVDFSYKQKMAMGLKNVEDSQARFLKYKNEVNKRCKQQLQAEIVRIRNFEIANIRMQEQQKYKLKMRELEEELEENYRLKMEKLREREAEVIQRVTSKMKEVESYNYQARQRMLKDLETIKAREEELERMKEQMSLASKTV